MKDYVIYYKFYPFNVCGLIPDKIRINANSLDEAFKKFEELYKGKAEVFRNLSISANL